MKLISQLGKFVFFLVILMAVTMPTESNYKLVAFIFFTGFIALDLWMVFGYMEE